MRWLKLDGGALFNLESVSYIYADAELASMITVDGNEDWSDVTIRQVWAALQEPNTMGPTELINTGPKFGICDGCGQLIHGGTEVYYHMLSGVYHVDCVPKATVGPQVDWQCNCGKKYFDINLSKPFNCTCGLPFGTPRK